jgi:PAS domain S-box-containing protein
MSAQAWMRDMSDDTSSAASPRPPPRRPTDEVAARDVTTERTARAAFAVVLGALVLTSVVSLTAVRTAVNSGAWVEHTLAVQKELAALSASIEAAESSYLEFVITAQEASLKRLENAQLASTRQLRGAEALTEDNPQQQQRIVELRRAVSEDFAFRAAVVTRRQEGGWEPAQALVIAEGGRRRLSRVRALITEMSDAEEGLLQERTTRTGAEVHLATLFGAALGVLALVVMGIGVFVIGRNLRFRSAAQTAIRKGAATAAVAVANLREMRASESIFRGLLEAAPDAVVIVGGDGKIRLVNSQTERLFGYTRQELVGQAVEMLMPERLRSAHPGLRGGYLAHPTVRAMGPGQDLCGRRRDGTEFPMEITLGPLDTEEGILVSSAIRDITERKRTESALRLVHRELESFSYSVAHDLRAPLRGMNGFAQLLLDTYRDRLDAEGQDWLQEIVLNAKKMGDLIDALLSLARVTRTEMKTQRVDLSELVRQAVDHLRAAEPNRVVTLEVQDHLEADVDSRLGRVLIDNLVGNAWKFSGPGPDARIQFGVTESRGHAAFFVRDNGAGFDMAFSQKLFAPFQRLHTVAEFPGTGIGLATVQRILHRHGGEVWAEGSVGKGATFYFTLPPKLLEARPS